MAAAGNKVLMYSSPLCGYCAAAKRLLKQKAVEFTDINVLFSAEKRSEMIELSGQTTVPQIFIGETHVGGFDDLYALDKDGRLDAMLDSVPNQQTQ